MYIYIICNIYVISVYNIYIYIYIYIYIILYLQDAVARLLKWFSENQMKGNRGMSLINEQR